MDLHVHRSLSKDTAGESADFSRDVEKAILTFSQALIFSLAIVISFKLLIISLWKK